MTTQHDCHPETVRRRRTGEGPNVSLDDQCRMATPQMPIRNVHSTLHTPLPAHKRRQVPLLAFSQVRDDITRVLALIRKAVFVERDTSHSLLLIGMLLASPPSRAAGQRPDLKPQFHTSDRCLACHNGLTTPSGQDVSIGFNWRASIMATSAPDPHWQASVRREDMDHPESKAEIEDGCADCHMPMSRYKAKLQGKLGQVFAHIPFDEDPEKNADAEDGV